MSKPAPSDAASGLPPRLLGAFSLSVLASIRALGPEAWGANLRRDLSARLGRDVAIGQLYLTLSRLAQFDLISSETTAPQPVQGGRAKKLFRLEPRAEQALASIR